MRRSRRNRPLVIALYLNAALLASLLVAYLARGTGSAALAAPPNGLPQIAGGNGVYLMPAQFTQANYGCYLIDTEKETLCAYEYMYGSKELRLIAARYYHHDRELQKFNTSPPPDDIQKINQTWKAGVRNQEPPVVTPADVNAPISPTSPLPASPSSPTSPSPRVQPVVPPQDGPINGVAPRDDAPPAGPATRPSFNGSSTSPAGQVPSPNEINSGVTPP